MKIITILGARPQFIKAATVSRAFSRSSIAEILLHTGQHYDRNMSEVFFQELGIPEPRYNLGISALNHGAMTGRMLEEIEAILIEESPDYALVYGDTNSTLAGALAAAKLNIPIVHVEAGLRSFNPKMPEEINRKLTDHMAAFLFVPTRVGVENLKAEGITQGVYHTGDVMYDAALHFGKISDEKSRILEALRIDSDYYLATVHRAENTDDPERLAGILSALAAVNETTRVVLPLHPRTRKIISQAGLDHYAEQLSLIEPLSYLDMVALEKNTKAIITDSGGVQKEAYYHGVPCITLREETEWTETVDAGWNAIVGSDCNTIIHAVFNAAPGRPIFEYGNGDAAGKITEILLSRENRNG